MQISDSLKITPPLWLIVLIVGLSQMSETVYSPSLPEIARALKTTASMVEYTLTVYLFGMAIGMLFWGKLSDSLGRKPCILAGLIIFIAGCFGCYFSTNITMLMISRVIQAFGGSVGSVLGQTICRDSFCGLELSRVYSSMSSSLAIFPAFGPIIGGLIADYLGWVNIFIYLILFGLVLITCVVYFLPETHRAENRKRVALADVIGRMLHDRKIIGLALLVGFAAGLRFSYYAEGSFFLIKALGLSPSYYGMSFFFIASATMIGGVVATKLLKRADTMNILKLGINIVFCAMILFAGIVLLGQYIEISSKIMILMTIGLQMVGAFGLVMITSNALSAALVDYRDCIGTASSLFGSFYMLCISIVTFGMGILHNGTLLPMPLYFLGLSVLMQFVYRYMIDKKLKVV